jgi:phosphoglycolate phosphatase
MTLPPTIVFDLDGTLVDTAADLAGAMNHCLALEHLPSLATDSVRGLVGHGARALLRRGLAAAGQPEDESRVDRLMPQFLDFYKVHVADHSRLYPGALAVLGELNAAGCALGICTNKPEALSLDLLGALGVLSYFGAVLGSDTLVVRKPDPQHLLATIERLGGVATGAVMVGDSIVDVTTAKAARVPVVGVTFGFSTEPMASLAPTVLVDGYDNMVAALRQAHGLRSF